MLKGGKPLEPLDMETLGFFLYMEQTERENRRSTDLRSWNEKDFSSENEGGNTNDEK